MKATEREGGGEGELEKERELKRERGIRETVLGRVIEETHRERR